MGTPLSGAHRRERPLRRVELKRCYARVLVGRVEKASPWRQREVARRHAARRVNEGLFMPVVTSVEDGDIVSAAVQAEAMPQRVQTSAAVILFR